MSSGGRTVINMPDDTDWSDEDIRRAFISKVCFIFGIQLLFTGAIVLLFLTVEDANEWLFENLIIVLIAAIVSIVVMLVLTCCQSTARLVPLNYILLMVFTVAESILVSYVSIKYKTETILIALGLTVIISLSLAMFAICAPCDFTGMGPFLLVVGIVFLLFGISLFFFRSRIMLLIFLYMGLLLFSLYLVYDVQLIVGGRRNQFSEEDYVIAALSIYVDVINIFIYLLAILDS